MAHDPWTNASNEPTLREFNFKAKVDVIRKSLKQGLKGGQTEFDQVFLIPDTSEQQAVDFLNAWLYPEPKVDKEENPVYAELLINVKDVWGAFRVGVDRDNKNYHKAPHMVVMSTYLEEKLANKVGQTVEIKTLSASEDVRDDRPDELDTTKNVQRLNEPIVIG